MQDHSGDNPADVCGMFTLGPLVVQVESLFVFPLLAVQARSAGKLEAWLAKRLPYKHSPLERI